MKRLLLVCRLGTRLEIGDNFTLNKITVLPTTSASLAYFIWRQGLSPDAADLRGKSLVGGYSMFEACDTRRAERARPFWCCLARHQKTGASAAAIDETVAARVPPRYAFGDRGQFYIK
ncbi:hypothetical protein NDU88_001209 [Pleurodeles waltl]|uniref:Uncharacterized protein n=1 Tax=Pleurodeles waltl TaxID=8319 RepID=A0AAV7UTE0_PLEWA|nr:hypothetical protein NDU88_001209 [Pleurodeles waltl]